MTFAADYLGQLERIAAIAAPPRLRALHLPPAAPAREGDNLGEFCAIELADGTLGLSYVLLDDMLARLRADPAGPLAEGEDALALARRYARGQGVERTLGFAAANAITRWFFDRAGFAPPDSGDSIGALDPRPGEAIGMIGWFSTLTERIVTAGACLTVVELNPAFAGERDGYRITLDPEALRPCEKVLSTSVLLLNDTLDRMLACCANARQVALIGPSAGCLPDALFARGVTSVGGSWVIDSSAFVDALRAGRKRGAAARKFALARQDYPGWRALAERL